MMATATQQPPAPSQTTDAAVIAALTVILEARLTAAVTAPYVIALLAPLGIPGEAAVAAVALLHPHIGRTPNVAPGTAQGHIGRTSTPRRAAYLLNASRRLSQGASPEAERHYLSQHLQAESIRQEVAHRVDAAARLFGPVLGWRAVMDSHTTPACKAANGNNFDFATPPLIGYPGTLHGGSCRCLPGPRFANGRIVDEVVTSGT